MSKTFFQGFFSQANKEGNGWEKQEQEHEENDNIKVFVIFWFLWFTVLSIQYTSESWTAPPEHYVL